MQSSVKKVQLAAKLEEIRERKARKLNVHDSDNEYLASRLEEIRESKSRKSAVHDSDEPSGRIRV